MPVEMKTCHNLNLRDHDLWDIYQHADWAPILETELSFSFKKRILLQVFGKMDCNSLHYGILSNYFVTYFLRRPEIEQRTLYISISYIVYPNTINLTLHKC